EGRPSFSVHHALTKVSQACASWSPSLSYSDSLVRKPCTPATCRIPPSTDDHSSNDPRRSFDVGFPATTHARPNVNNARTRFSRFACTHCNRSACLKPVRSQGLGSSGSNAIGMHRRAISFDSCGLLAVISQSTLFGKGGVIRVWPKIRSVQRSDV